MKNLLPPLVTCALVVMLAWSGSKAETYDINMTFHCAAKLAEASLPPADVLIAGNSQTGAAVDPLFVARKIDPTGGTRVERLAIVEAHIAVLRMILEDYVEHRGPPGLLILQSMLVRDASWQMAAGRPIHPRANVVLQEWDELVELQSDADVRTSGRLPAFLQAGYRSLPALYVDRIVERIAAALSYVRLNRWVESCDGDRKFTQSFLWPYDVLPIADDISSLDPPGQATAAEWERRVAARLPLDLERPERNFELQQYRDLFAFMQDHGVRVVLVGYPTYSTPAVDANDFRRQGVALGQTVHDLRGKLEPERAARLDGLFRDPFHLNFLGAQLIADPVADLAISESK